MKVHDARSGHGGPTRRQKPPTHKEKPTIPDRKQLLRFHFLWREGAWSSRVRCTYIFLSLNGVAMGVRRMTRIAPKRARLRPGCCQKTSSPSPANYNGQGEKENAMLLVQSRNAKRPYYLCSFWCQAWSHCQVCWVSLAPLLPSLLSLSLSQRRANRQKYKLLPNLHSATYVSMLAARDYIGYP